MDDGISSFGCRIARLGLEHMEALCALEKLCFASSWSVEQFRDACREPWFVAYGIFLQNSLVCYLTLSSVGDELEILNVAVHPQWRRQSLASRLIQYAFGDIARARGAVSVFLEVNETNVPAIALYKKTGFNIIGFRRKYYDGIHDAILMSMRLPVGLGKE